MKRFIIERKLPGAGNMTAEELKAISDTSKRVIAQIDKPYTWVESYITEDAIYCVHEAESEEVIREHAALCRFPVNRVEEVRVVLRP